MTDPTPTPTPADLERAREWLEWSDLCFVACGEYDGDAHEDLDLIASLAALLRSVREEGARQERAKLIGAVESHLKWLRAQDAPAPVVRKVEMISGLLENTP